jgi:hypothetical protein
LARHIFLKPEAATLIAGWPVTVKRYAGSQPHIFFLEREKNELRGWLLLNKEGLVIKRGLMLELKDTLSNNN